MKSPIAASALAMCALWFPLSANAQPPPPLPAAAASFDAGSLHVDVYGTAGKPALILIPGLACGPWEWSREIAHFSPSYAIYALTLPGFDGRPAIDGPLFQTVTSDFWTMLDAHGIRQPIVVGHSLGGTLAIALAEQHAEKLRGAVAVEGLPVFPGIDKMTEQQRTAAAARFASMMGAATPQQFEATERSAVIPNYVRSKGDVDAIVPLVAKTDPKAAGAWMAADIGSDLRPGLHAVTVPLLEIVPYDASFDGAMFASAQIKAAYYASLLASDPAAQTATIPDSRHFVMYDQPAKLDAALDTFLSGLH